MRILVQSSSDTVTGPYVNVTTTSYAIWTHLCHISAASAVPREVQPELNLRDAPLTR